MSDGPSDTTLPPPGPDGTPIPEGVSTLRLGPDPSRDNMNNEGRALLQQGKAWPGLFVFNSKERKAAEGGLKPRLSVWHSGYTSVAQAWVLVGGKPANRVVLTLSSECIRLISAVANNDSPATPFLEVAWERAVRPHPEESDRVVPDDRPGSAGHCGIENLWCGSKAQQKNLRQQLADSVPEGGLMVLNDEQIEGFQRLGSAEA